MNLFLIITLIFLLSLLPDTLGYTVSGNEIFDLENNGAAFDTEATAWTAVGLKTGGKTTTCGVVSLISGANKLNQNGYYSRTYSSLPSHNIVYFSITFYAIDDWVSADKVKITIGGLSQYVTGISSTTWTSSICGNAQKDVIFTVAGSVAHSASSITVTFTNELTQGPNQVSFGVRDLKLKFQTDSLPLTQRICGSSSTVNMGSFTTCCTGATYLNTYSCDPCDPSCSTCTGGTSTDCTGCSTGYFSSGGACITCDTSCLTCSGAANTQCTSCKTGDYLYPSGKCLTGCNPPMVKSSTGGVDKCTNPCTAGQYLYWYGVCQNTCGGVYIQNTYEGVNMCLFPCTGSDFRYSNSSCLTSCDAPFIQSTYYGAYYCNFPCSATQYLLENLTCTSSCGSPFTSLSSGVANYCLWPCGSSSPFYLVDTSSCVSSCDPPFISSGSGVESYCDWPCGAAEYYFDNGTCIVTGCSSPFVPTTNGIEKYCDFPCVSGQFYFQNSTCITTACNAPFVQRIQGVENYCDWPCPGVEFYFDNDTCLTSSCSAPFVQKIQGLESYCKFKCGTSKYLDTSNDVCVSSCDTPYNATIIDMERYCDWTCDTSPDIYYHKGTDTCLSKCEAPSVMQSDGTYLSCPKSSVVDTVGDSAVFAAGYTASGITSILSIMVMNKFLFYLRHIDIDFPTNLKYFFYTHNNTISMNYHIPCPDVIKNLFAKPSIPSRYADHNLEASFIVNYWDNFTTILATLIGSLMFLLIAKILRKFKHVSVPTMLEFLKLIIKWNLLLLMFCSTYGEIALFTAVRFSTISIKSTYDILDIIFCLAFVGGGIAVLVLSFTLVKKSQLLRRRIAPVMPLLPSKPSGKTPTKSKDKVMPVPLETPVDTSTDKAAEREAKGLVKSFNSKWEAWQVLFKGYKDTSFSRQAFLSYFILRAVIYNIIIAGAFSSPVAQTVMITVLSILMMLYMVIKRPFLRISRLFEQLLFEAIILVANVCMVILSVVDDSDIRTSVGEIIIFCFNLFSICAVSFLTIRFVERSIAAWKASRAYRGKGKLGWLQVLTIFFQTGGMDFPSLDRNLLERLDRKKSKAHKKDSREIVPLAELIKPRPLVQTVKLNDSSKLDHFEIRPSARESLKFSSQLPSSRDMLEFTDL